MVYIAYYKLNRLLGLAAIGVLFMAMGTALAMQPAGAFDHSAKIELISLLFGGDNDLAGHAVGCITIAFGAAVLPIIAKQMNQTEPAMRIDQHGIYWHRWSPKPIPWSNIARFAPAQMYRQKFVCLWFHHPDREPGRGLLAKTARANKALGFGDLALTTQGTGKTFEELLEAVAVNAERYQQSLRSSLTQPLKPVELVGTRPLFGRKRD